MQKKPEVFGINTLSSYCLEAVEADKLAAQEAARGGSYRREMANKYVNDRDEMIKDAEARAKELDARHANYAAAAIVENEMLEVNEEDKLLAPTENDPKLWIVSCRVGIIDDINCYL